jgi:hypothetical protein
LLLLVPARSSLLAILLWWRPFALRSSLCCVRHAQDNIWVGFAERPLIVDDAKAHALFKPEEQKQKEAKDAASSDAKTGSNESKASESGSSAGDAKETKAAVVAAPALTAAASGPPAGRAYFLQPADAFVLELYRGLGLQRLSEVVNTSDPITENLIFDSKVRSACRGVVGTDVILCFLQVEEPFKRLIVPVQRYLLSKDAARYRKLQEVSLRRQNAATQHCELIRFVRLQAGIAAKLAEFRCAVTTKLYVVHSLRDTVYKRVDVETGS